MTNVEDLKALVDRIDGKADRMAAVDRLRAYIAAPETFLNINVDDAEEINELLLEASSGIDALLARLDSAEKALKLAAEEIEELRRFANNNGATIDEEKFVEGRAHLSQYGERT